MTIDPMRDELLSYEDIRKILPPRNGKPVPMSTLYKWSAQGIGGHVLATIKIGRQVVTSRAALSAFFKATNAPASPKREKGKALANA
jgi:hypothetical protein